MSIRWIFIVLLVAYGLHTFAAVENFNEIIEKNIEEQNQSATKVKSNTSEAKNTKTLEGNTDIVRRL